MDWATPATPGWDRTAMLHPPAGPGRNRQYQGAANGGMERNAERMPGVSLAPPPPPRNRGGRRRTEYTRGAGGRKSGWLVSLEDHQVELPEAAGQTRDVRAQRYREGGFGVLPARPAIT